MTLALFTVIDLETTGLAPPASIVEIGWTKVYFDTDTKQVEISAPQARLFRPLEPQAPEVVAVHHLTDAMLAPYQVCTEDDIRAVLDEERPNFIVAAHCAFEQAWLTSEVVGANLDGKAPHWICTVKAAARLYPDAESHANQAMRYRLGLDLPEHLAMPPHRAGPDSFVTAHILAAFLAAGARASHMVHWTTEPRWMPTIRFGKHRGTAWADLPLDYLQWMDKATDMDPDALHWARVELERRREAA